MRPEGINDLQVMWAIRDIPADIITPNERLLLFILVTTIGNKGSCYDSVSDFANKTGLSERTIQYGLKSLSNKKLIKIKAPKLNGRGYANEYFLNYFAILGHSERVQDLHPSMEKGAGAAPITPERVQNLQKKGAGAAPREKDIDIHKSREEEPAVLQPEKPEQKRDQTLYNRKTFTFTHAEQDDAIRRDIHIQPCFNNFVLHLAGKGRDEFERWEWEMWFARELPGRKAKFKRPEDDQSTCSRCGRPAKGCYCDRPDERPAITGGLNGLKHIGSLM